MQPLSTEIKPGFSAIKLNMWFVYTISLVAAVGGLLFGFDIAIMAGAIPFLTRRFSLTPEQLGFTVAAVALGCVLGTVIAGSLSDRLGRKKLLLISALVFFVSSIVAAFPNSAFTLALARIFSGLAIGISSPISPVYISEIAPANIRGRLVTFNQLAITVGFLGAYIVGWTFASIGTPEWRDEYSWRFMFATGALPSALFILLLLNTPESPRYLLKKDDSEGAISILSRIGGNSYAEAELARIQATLHTESTSVAQLFRKPFLTPMVIGILLMVYSQVTGLKAITNYCPKLLMELGFQSESGAMRGMVAVGIVLATSTILAMIGLDKIGRKKMLALTNIGIVTSLLLFAGQFYFNLFPSWFILIIALFAVVSYAAGIGPISWLIISEVFPTSVRGTASSIATFTNWTADFFVLLYFPVMQQWSQVGTFLVFAGISAFFSILLQCIVPETKGKTLEEIELSWRNKRA